MPPRQQAANQQQGQWPKPNILQRAWHLKSGQLCQIGKGRKIGKSGQDRSPDIESE
jgi:hypothetical protein